MSEAPPLVSLRPSFCKLTGSFEAWSLITFAVTPVVPPATIAKDGDDESVEPTSVAPVETAIVGAEPPIEPTVTVEPEVTPVGAIAVVGANEYVSVLGALDERLHVI
jgi:hypothetical protein